MTEEGIVIERAALYARTSYNDQKNDGRNLEGQIRMGREYAKEKGYEIAEEIMEDERGASGANWSLAGISRMLELAKNREINVVVIREVDRFSRDLGKLLWLEKELEKYRVRIEYVLESYDTTPEGDLLRHIRGIIAQYEREKIKQRSVRGRRNKVLAGHVSVGGQPPYGYAVAKQSNLDTLEIAENEAAIVFLIFEWYAGPERLGIRKIAQRLTQMKVPTLKDLRVPDPEKLKKIKRQNGYGHWTGSSVRMILSNRTYIGEWQFGKRKLSKGQFIKNPDDHLITVEVPAIIPKDMWDTAQQRLKENRSEAKRNIKYEYLLAKKLTCQCGLKIIGHAKWNRGVLYQYYRCPSMDSFRYSSNTCTLPSFRVDYVDGIIWEWLKSIFTDRKTLQEALTETKTEQEENREVLQGQLDSVENLIAEHKSQLERAIDLHLTGKVAQEMLQEKISGLELAIQSLEKERKILTAQIAQQDVSEDQAQRIIDEFVVRVGKGVFYAKDDFNARRQLIEALDFEGKLAVENGQKVIYVRCILGDTVLPVMNVDWQAVNSWQTVNTIAPAPLAATNGPFIITPTSRAMNLSPAAT
ncbi:MAG: DNA recombinase [Chloroflexota bacterium]|nr:MAG: DNA recombinase [Chloroflexota bacterium]